jgi:hypothetical protein
LVCQYLTDEGTCNAFREKWKCVFPEHHLKSHEACPRYQFNKEKVVKERKEFLQAQPLTALYNSSSKGSAVLLVENASTSQQPKPNADTKTQPPTQPPRRR